MLRKEGEQRQYRNKDERRYTREREREGKMEANLTSTVPAEG